MRKRVPAYIPSIPVLFLLLGNSAAQAVHTVGPTGHAEIADAIAAAAPGDLIVVEPGSYLPFAVPIGVRIVAPDGATVTTPPGGFGIPWEHDVHPPAGQQATIVGLEFRTNPVYPPAEPPVALHVTGNVAFADCVFHNWPDYPHAAVTCDGDVQFDRCEWSSVHDAMVVLGGRVEANDCVFRAETVMWAPPGASCLVAHAGQVTLHSCDLRGSPASSPTSLIGAPAIRLDGLASLRLADCVVAGGSSITWASTAIHNQSPNPVLHARSTVTGGSGLLLQVPPLYGTGPGYFGPQQATPRIGGLAVATGPQVGGTYYATTIAPWNSPVALVLAFERTEAIAVPFAAEPVHFDPATATLIAIATATDFVAWSEYGACTWLVGQLTPAMFGGEFWLHPLVFDGTLFQVGPTFGGLVR
jgi:hypothetical protein